MGLERFTPTNNKTRKENFAHELLACSHLRPSLCLSLSTVYCSYHARKSGGRDFQAKQVSVQVSARCSRASRFPSTGILLYLDYKNELILITVTVDEIGVESYGKGEFY